MKETIYAVLTRPNSFFDQRDANPSLLYPTVIVAVIGILSAIASVPPFLALSRGLPAEVQPFLAVGAVIGFLSAIIGPFVVWLLYAIVFQILSYFFDGDGTFRETFILSGWGFLPQIIGSALSLVATVLVLQTHSLPAEDGPQAMQAFEQQLRNDPLLSVVSVIGIGLTLWSGYIWLFAVKHACDLSRRHALITVAVPVFISIGISLFNVLRL